MQLACKLNSAAWMPGIAARWLMHRSFQSSACDLMLAPNILGLHHLFGYMGLIMKGFRVLLKMESGICM